MLCVPALGQASLGCLPLPALCFGLTIRPPAALAAAVCAQRLVQEIAAHKHHLQDAAQYTLGNLTAVVLVRACCA